MAEPRTRPRPSFANDDDAGFPPLRDPDNLSAGEDVDADDRDDDFHEEGGGD
jgi:hypothetical protein